MSAEKAPYLFFKDNSQSFVYYTSSLITKFSSNDFTSSRAFQNHNLHHASYICSSLITPWLWSAPSDHKYSFSFSELRIFVFFAGEYIRFYNIIQLRVPEWRSFNWLCIELAIAWKGQSYSHDRNTDAAPFIKIQKTGLSWLVFAFMPCSYVSVIQRNIRDETLIDDHNAYPTPFK